MYDTIINKIINSNIKKYIQPTITSNVSPAFESYFTTAEVRQSSSAPIFMNNGHSNSWF